MQIFRKISLLLLSLVIVFSMTVTGYGASTKKTMYLPSGHTIRYYDSGDLDYKSNTKFTYYKNGLVKTYKKTDSDGQIKKGTYHYNSKHRATKLTYTSTNETGTRNEKYCEKFSYNKNGYLTKARLYWIDNGTYKLLWSKKLSWNDDNKLSKVSHIDSDGTVETTVWFKYNKKGKLMKEKSYDSWSGNTCVVWYNYNKNGKLIKRYSTFKDDPFFEYYTYDGNKRTMKSYKEKAKETLIEKRIETYENGNLIREKTYGGDGYDINDMSEKNTHTYKTVSLSSKYRKRVTKQQKYLNYLTPEI